MTKNELEEYKLPDHPGVYTFWSGKKILYVGKATSLRDRTRSYVSRDLIRTRGPLIVKMVEEANRITWEETDSVLEALILEANLIKRYNPIYNSKEKDDRSYNFVVVTEETYPRIHVARGREILHGVTGKGKIIGEYRSVFGPYPNGSQLREALIIVRKIFPFRDKCTPYTVESGKKPKPCFNKQIGLCPGVCDGTISEHDYEKIVKNIELFFSAKKEQVRKNLEKDMNMYAKLHAFEKADQVKKQLFALDHIRDVSLMSREKMHTGDSQFRIEGYDIAHISGKDTVGVMTVVINGEIEKNEYRKFKIRGGEKGVFVNDIANLKELISRRLEHTEWKLPNLIVVDGGVAQKNAAETILVSKGFSIPVVAVVKNERHKPKDLLGRNDEVTKYKHDILLVNSESHRFAQTYHTTLRRRPYRTR